VALTKESVAAGKTLAVAVLDHLTIGHGRWISPHRVRPDIFPPLRARIVDPPTGKD
jgi:hypothetical protein